MKLLGTVIYDIVQLLESSQDSSERVSRTLELLRELVPYDQCVLLEARLGKELRVVTMPELEPDRRDRLIQKAVDIFGQLVDGKVSAVSVQPDGFRLAVPLVGLDEVIGLLFVRSESVNYNEDNLRSLSAVASMLASYLTMLSDRSELTDLVLQLDQARRSTESNHREKDKFLTRVLDQLKAPASQILQSAQLLRSGADENQTHSIDAIQRSALTQVKVIDENLGAVGLASAELRLNLALADPTPAITEALEMIRSEVDQVSGPLPPVNLVDSLALAGVTVLLVEHDLGLRETFEIVLTNSGAKVTTVATGPEALAELERSRPNVVLFGDLATREESIADLIHEVTARSCPIGIASFSGSRHEERRRAMGVGLGLHLANPFEIENLVQAVAGLAGRTEKKGNQA